MKDLSLEIQLQFSGTLRVPPCYIVALRDGCSASLQDGTMQCGSITPPIYTLWSWGSNWANAARHALMPWTRWQHTTSCFAGDAQPCITGRLCCRLETSSICSTLFLEHVRLLAHARRAAAILEQILGGESEGLCVSLEKCLAIVNYRLAYLATKFDSSWLAYKCCQ